MKGRISGTFAALALAFALSPITTAAPYDDMETMPELVQDAKIAYENEAPIASEPQVERPAGIPSSTPQSGLPKTGYTRLECVGITLLLVAGLSGVVAIAAGIVRIRRF